MGRFDRFSAVVCGVPLLVALLACGEGGENENQHVPGNEPGGVKIGLGDLAVAPVGDYVLFKKGDDLAVGWTNTGLVQTLPVSNPSRLAFSELRPVVYVASKETGTVLGVNVQQQKLLWKANLSATFIEEIRLVPSPDDRFLLAANAGTVRVFDSATGATKISREFQRGVVDVEILPDSSRALVVESHTWTGDEPATRITVIDIELDAEVRFDVPNCADNIKIAKDGSHALLAPTTCAKDPISVINLTKGAEAFERNLPGFGPVALAPDGTTAVGFLDQNNIDESLFDDPTQIPDSSSAQYHLMLIDTTTLEFELVEVGDSLPRFSLTPDGSVVLVDSKGWVGGDESVRLLDVPSRIFRDVEGPAMLLNNFVISRDSKHVYALDGLLYDLDIDSASNSQIPTSFAPKNINIGPRDEVLFLRKSSTSICIFDLSTRSCRRHFDSPVVRP